MPQRDTIHNLVKQALINAGWQITDDPFVISYGERFLFVDLGASSVLPPNQVEGQLIGAEREGKQIAVEVKEFRGKSAIADLEQAVGQYMLYRLLLKKVDSERDLYLAITDRVYDEIFSEPIGELIIDDLPMKLIAVNSEESEVAQWIPPQSIATL